MKHYTKAQLIIFSPSCDIITDSSPLQLTSDVGHGEFAPQRNFSED